eukprot:1136279-Rhodomonas_salina.1
MCGTEPAYACVCSAMWRAVLRERMLLRHLRAALAYDAMPYADPPPHFLPPPNDLHNPVHEHSGTARASSTHVCTARPLAVAAISTGSLGWYWPAA